MKEVIKYGKYSATIHYSKEDKVYYGVVQDITDSVTFEGRTSDELDQSFMEAIKDYESMIELEKNHSLGSGSNKVIKKG